MTLGPSINVTASPFDTRTAYSTLGLHPGCSHDEISRAYKLLASHYHPDRPKGDAILFSQLSSAYDCLSSPVTRAIYDIESGIVEDNESNHNKIHRLRRQEALASLKLMFNKVHNITQREQSRNGLLIVSGKYGDLNSDNGDDRVLDVTMQLQSMVNESLLIIRDGSSKSWLEGFYDPTQGEENFLYCVYKLGGKLHSVTVNDWEELVIPQQSHLMNDKQCKTWEKQFALHSDRLNDIAIKRRRRYLALAGLTCVGIGAFVYYKHRQSQSQAASNKNNDSKNSSITLIPGIGGLASGSKQLASIINEWVEFLSNYTKTTLQSFYSNQTNSNAANVPAIQLGSKLVKSNSALWTNDISLPLTQ